MPFCLEDLVTQFDEATYSRGDSYARSGKVISVRESAGRLEGEVSGSGGAVYRQKIRFKMDGDEVRIEGSCSCPVSRNCKHVVATLLVNLQQAEDGMEQGFSALAEQWAQLAARTVEHSLANAVPPLRSGPQYRLAFFLVPHPDDGAPRLQLCYARVRKDGGLSSVTLPQNPSAVLLAPESSLSPREEEAVRLLGALNLASRLENRPLSGPIGAALLDKLSHDGRLYYAASRAAQVRNLMQEIVQGPARKAELAWSAAGEAGDLLRLQWRFDDGAIADHVFATEPPYYLANGVLGQLLLPATPRGLQLATLLSMVEQAPPLLPGQGAAMAQRMVEQGLDQVLPLPQLRQTRQRDDIAAVPYLLLDSRATAPPPVRWGSGASTEPVWHDYAQLWFDYDGLQVGPGSPDQLRRVLDDTIELIPRDLVFEQNALAMLTQMGFRPADSHPSLLALEGSLQLASSSAWELFAARDIAVLEEVGWEIIAASDYRYDHDEVDDWYADLAEDAEPGNEWFSLELGIVVDGERYALLPLLVDYLHGLTDAQVSGAGGQLGAHGADLFVELDAGRRVRLPWPRLQPLLAILREMHFREEYGEAARLPFTSAARLAELEAAAQLPWLGGETLRALGRKLHDFDGITEAPVPLGLQAQLRPYQRAGLSWLQFLREHNFGGILADDMGLGKTAQTLAHILLEKEAGRLDRPALVVAPTSLMGNWQSEAARFAPGLRVLLLHGKERIAQFDAIAHADLVLTTYALLSRDEQALRQHRYHLLILDEAQYIKNSRAKAAQTVCLLDARHRVCLTGTPVQNHLGELWSQFHFLMPGLLGNLRTFNAGIRKPIEQQGDSTRQALLNARIKPFMLRRTKDKVATELPPKTEIMLSVEFDSAQRDLYETVRVAMDQKVRQEIDRRGLSRSHIVILDALLKLRQVCCDPRLLKKPVSTAGSAKMDTLLELLDTLLSEGRKILIFSQFTSMLALIGDALRARAVDYALLQGDTVDRADAIATFQGGQVSVFLISLKAGGVGLNLTAADTVIHYDPWWNPASENQATDRAWRIGQTQPVFVYKLIAQGTVEEKIQAMQKKKGDLAKAVLDAEGGLAGGMDARDLQAIFAQ
ncbi:MAG: SNF2-related protein [Massilia sp.]